MVNLTLSLTSNICISGSFLICCESITVLRECLPLPLLKPQVKIPIGERRALINSLFEGLFSGGCWPHSLTIHKSWSYARQLLHNAVAPILTKVGCH